jgi:hypothetical protein
MLISDWSRALRARRRGCTPSSPSALIATGFSGVLSGPPAAAPSSDAAALTPGAFRTAGLVLILSAIANVSFVFLRFGQR